MKHGKLIVALLCASTMAMGAGLLAACGGHKHSWKWQSDADEHWQICEEDSTEKEGSRGAHVDEDSNGKCDVCERAMTPSGHTHQWKWQSDANEHWQICEEDSTEKDGSRGPHVDADGDGECDTCKRELSPAQGGDLFSKAYIGKWEARSSYGSEGISLSLEITANAAKFNGTAVTVTKSADGAGQVYSFTGSIDGKPCDLSFTLTEDGYAILLSHSFEEDGETHTETFTLIEENYEGPDDFISAPTGYVGDWASDDDFALTVSEDGDVYFGDEPMTILVLDAEGVHATAFVEVESMTCWAEIYFDENEISVNIAGIGSFTFAPITEEPLEFPNELRGDWVEIGGNRTISIDKDTITIGEEDVTATAVVEYMTVYFAMEDGEEYELNITSDEYVLYLTKGTGTAKTLFLNDMAPSLKLAAADALKDKTFTPASVANTLGNLAVAADGTLTLGSKATQVLSLEIDYDANAVTAFTFLCDGMWYRAVVEDTITLTDINNKTYKFDGESLSDLSEYVGEWKQVHPYTTVTVTITATEFKYNGEAKQCFRSLDGTLYYKNGNYRTPFGLLDEEGTILYLKMSSTYWFFTKDGEMPTVTSIPEVFRGKWTSDNYFGLEIDASTITVDGKAYTPFAVTGEEGEKAIHVISNNGEYFIFTMGEDAVLMSDGSITRATFRAVKPDLLPEGYHGEWTALSGDDTVSVDDDGKFTYNGKVYPTTIDDHDGSYHFTLENSTMTLELSSDGYVLWIDEGDYNVTYFIKGALTDLPDIKLTELANTSWTNADQGITLTFDETGAAAIDTEKVQILTQEADNADTIGTLIYSGAWYDFRISGNTITITNATASIAFIKQGAQPTFTAPQEMIGTWILRTFLAPESIGGTSQLDKDFTLKIAAHTLTWEETIVAVTEEGEGKYSFTTTSPIVGDEEATYTFWLQGDILLLDDGANTYVLFISTWEDNLESSVAVPSEIATGDWTGANGEKLQISTPSDSDTGHEAFITVKDKNLSGDPIWLFTGATATLCTGYCKPVGPSHYVYAEMSLSGTTLTVKLYFDFDNPDIYTFTQKTVEETYKVPNMMQDTWTLYTNGALDDSHVIEMEQKSITFDGEAVTGVTVEGDVVTFTASDGKKYTAKLDETEYALYLQAEGENTYAIYVSALADNTTLSVRAKAASVLDTTWTSSDGKGDLVIDANGENITLNGEKIFVLGETMNPAEGFGSPTFKGFYFVVGGMWYEAVFSGNTLTLTDLDGNSYTYTKAE